MPIKENHRFAEDAVARSTISTSVVSSAVTETKPSTRAMGRALSATSKHLFEDASKQLRIEVTCCL